MPNRRQAAFAPAQPFATKDAPRKRDHHHRTVAEDIVDLVCLPSLRASYGDTIAGRRLPALKATSGRAMTGRVPQVEREAAVSNSAGSYTMIVVAHEMDIARAISTEVVFLEKGLILEKAPPAKVFVNPDSERVRKFLERMD